MWVAIGLPPPPPPNSRVSGYGELSLIPPDPTLSQEKQFGETSQIYWASAVCDSVTTTFYTESTQNS